MGEMITVPVKGFDFFFHQCFEGEMDWPWQLLPHRHTHTLGEVDHYNNVSTVCLALLS